MVRVKTVNKTVPFLQDDAFSVNQLSASTRGLKKLFLWSDQAYIKRSSGKKTEII